MANFATAYIATKGHEGIYSIDSDDRGGETAWGIARNRWPHWPGWKIIDRLKRSGNLLAQLANHAELKSMRDAFYKREFWDKLRLDQVRYQPIANELFDTAVNQGVKLQAFNLQRCLNISNQGGKYYPDLVVDGYVGPITIAALNSHPRPYNVLKALNVLQGAKYIELCENDKSQEKYFHGWFNRVFEYSE